MIEAEIHASVPKSTAPHLGDSQPRADMVILTLALEVRQRELLRANQVSKPVPGQMFSKKQGLTEFAAQERGSWRGLLFSQHRVDTALPNRVMTVHEYRTASAKSGSCTSDPTPDGAKSNGCERCTKYSHPLPSDLQTGGGAGRWGTRAADTPARCQQLGGRSSKLDSIPLRRSRAPDQRYWRKRFFNRGRTLYTTRILEIGAYEGTSVFGAPRWLWGHLMARDVAEAAGSLMRFDAAETFDKQREIWMRLGQIHEALSNSEG